MKPIWSPSLRPPSSAAEAPPEAPPPSEGVSSDALLHRDSAEAVSALLSSLTQFAIDLPSRRGVAFVAQCFGWAASATRGSLARKPVLSGSQAPAATTDWHGLAHFFREQRVLEKQHVSTGKAALLETVQSLGRAFQLTLSEGRSLDAESLRQVAKLASALAQGTETALLAAANETLPLLRSVAERRQARSHPQLVALRQKVAELERAALLSALSTPFERDEETGLNNVRSLTAHCEFLASIVSLFENPPTLILFQCTAVPPDEVAAARLAQLTSHLLQQVFPSPQQFLARATRDLYAVVLAGPSATDAKARAEAGLAELARQAQQHQFRATLARLITGETREAWFERCTNAQSRTKAFQLGVAEAPAEFIA